MTYSNTMEQVAFDIHGAVEEIQQLQRLPVEQNGNVDEASDDGLPHDDGASMVSPDNNDNDSAASAIRTGTFAVVSAVKIRNDVRRCLRELDDALGRLLNLEMEREEQEQSANDGQLPQTPSSVIVPPMLQDLMTIVVDLDLCRLQVQEGNPNYGIYQSVFQKASMCLRDHGYLLNPDEAVKVINLVLGTLQQGLQQRIQYFSRPEEEIERIRGLLTLLNHTMGMKADQQQQRRQQERGEGTNDMDGHARTSCFEEVLGGNFDTLDLLATFLRIGIDCLQDEEMREARATSISQNDVQEGNKVRVQNILTFVDFLLMHVHDSMGNTQSRTLEEYFWTLLSNNDPDEHESMRGDEDDKGNDKDANYIGWLSRLVQNYTSELIGAAFDEMYAANSFFEAFRNDGEEEEDTDHVVGNDGDGSTGNSNSSRKEEDCAKSTPSSITGASLSSRSNVTDTFTPDEEAGSGLEALDSQHASYQVTKLAGYPLFVCTALQVIGGDRGVLDPVKLKEVRSLWVSYTKLFLAVKKYQDDNALPLSDDATLAGTDSMIRLGVLAMADIITVDAGEVAPSLDPEVIYVVSISLLAAIEFPEVLYWNSDFLVAVSVVTVQNSELRHLIQGVTLRELVFPTSGSIRDPLAMMHVTTRLIEIVQLAMESCEAKGTLDRWDCFYRDQLAKQQQSQEEPGTEMDI